MSAVTRALLSVSDKSGLTDLARGLADLGIGLVSTGGTERHLVAAGLPVKAVADVTGFPEMLDGRVKTMHPRIHADVLAGHLAGLRQREEADELRDILGR